MGDEKEHLFSKEGSARSYYGTNISNAHQWKACSESSEECRRALQKKQRRLVFIVLLCMFVMVVSSLAWGIPIILAKLVLQLDPLPSSSKEGVYGRAAVSADSTVCPPIGRSVLENGGSAVDAAVAMLLCQGVSDPHRSGLGGGLYMVVYQRSNRTAHALDARETAPVKASEDMFLNSTQSGLGGLFVAVPGELVGLWEAHKKFGVLPWSELVEPSIKLCEQGVEVSNNVAKFLQKFKDVVLSEPTMREIFTKSGTDKLLKAGDIMKNPSLGKTLRVIAKEGAQAIYNGSLSRALVDDVKRAGGIMKEKDLAAYKPRWEEAITTTLQAGDKQLRMFTTPPPSGGVILSYILNILEGYNMGPQNFATTAEQVTTLHRTVEAFKHSFAMRPLLGDPEYVDMKKLLQNLLSKKFAEKKRKMINDLKTLANHSYYGAKLLQVEDSGTTHVCVLAPNGDAVSATSTINFNFGSGVMSASTGIILNNEMNDFNIPNTTGKDNSHSSNANFIFPKKRPLSSMAPTIFIDETGDIRLVIGGAGGIKIITSVAYVTIRNLWLGNTIKEAIDARRIHHQLLPNILQYEYGVLPQQIDGLMKRHHTLEEVLTEQWLSHVNAIEKRADGKIVANSDFRQYGTVDGID